jgi:hypothetical protein
MPCNHLSTRHLILTHRHIVFSHPLTAASSPLELQSQVLDTLNVSSHEARLSHRSRAINASSSSFEDLAIQPYSTIDLSFRLRGGGPKKRCAHVSVKTGSASNTPSTSGVATPSSSTAPASEEKKEDDKDTAIVQDQEAKVETAVIPSATEPVLERCSNAALVSSRPSLLFSHLPSNHTDLATPSPFVLFLQRMVGECTKCNKNFCGQHRLPEDHACPALQTFRKAAFEENMKRLNKEATFTNKISAF